MLIDTHLHLIDRSKLTYPWLSGVPALDRDFLYNTYAAEARRCGIDAALHMEVDVDAGEMQRETDVVRELSDTSGQLIRGAIAACRPEDEGFAGYLERQMADPFVKGFRRVLHVLPEFQRAVLERGENFFASICRVSQQRNMLEPNT